MTVKVFAPAKINLTLHVTGQREDGYHLLDSLVAFVDVGDQITASPAAASTFEVTGPFAAGVPTDETNLALRAARLAEWPMEILLDKRLPPASGIGGGSADAAATLRAAARLGATPVSAERALTLGADLPVCLSTRPARMTGVGERLRPVSMPVLHLVLVNPRVEVATPAVFAGLERRDNTPMPEILPDWPDALAMIDWLSTQRNDLEGAAVGIAPEITAALAALAQAPGARMVRMSGSGATCFALFEDRYRADVAAAQLTARNPWWWVRSASTLPV
ncbi:4-(cytidine 5'-diphospho)-2-C-methyl-D-erythritol kinase [Celeribacter indicus]|uniref:4-diphosphocytidyl-2-C-methyl-D-erythritol kinase n=1 Tax=Celeribacter indicus TaxID=1208324 RepID=A0A0B5E9H1_9RHOB|nr:4-(cytidine 5'-diphospho)-2-C-methyl-D-erythritol kinase [Celeribacter indicus]AJE48977.1 4-diphosphocytidyl-2-C-methyl-D-erythritol kinase [Celeribacter indicus]SDW42805.1 4-diphosphocytidyl-2-C-methyl-D-erythritol kinase [Celeribacter indicus]